MDELEKEKNKIKKEARKKSVNNVKKEIEENYKIGIKYLENIEKYENQ